MPDAQTEPNLAPPTNPSPGPNPGPNPGPSPGPNPGPEAPPSSGPNPEPPGPILPPATIGILGGGQLGRMLGFAARSMGYRVIVLDPDPDCPARAIADDVEVARYDDVAAALRLAARSAVVTIELEHIAPPVIEALRALADPRDPAGVGDGPGRGPGRAPGGPPLRPGSFAIRRTQDRIAERRFLDSIGAPVAAWREVRTPEDLRAATAELAGGGLADGGSRSGAVTGFRLKAAIGGYDGRSQVPIPQEPDAAELAAAFEALARSASAHGLVLEREVDFLAELSVVVGRATDGTVRPYPVARNVHDQGILTESVVPADLEPGVAEAARALACRIAVELDVVGVMAVEMFLRRDGSLAVNEIAPRVHNSGHWTIEACRTSQFEQHVRAVCGLPLGSAELASPAATVNVLGTGRERDARLEGAAAALSDARVHLHLYDKRRVFERRKMGHVTATSGTATDALARARRAAALLTWAGSEVEPG